MRTFVFGACALAVSATALGQSFVNPNFDGNADGWTETEIFTGGYQSTTGSDGNPGWFWINNNGSAGNIPRVSQTLSGFTPGQAYTITFWTKTNVLFFNDDRLEVRIDGVTEFLGPNERINGWRELSFDWEATSSEHTIEWAAEISSDSDWGLDTVSITPVPEPATMTALGIGALALLRRRKKA